MGLGKQESEQERPRPQGGLAGARCCWRTEPVASASGSLERAPNASSATDLSRGLGAKCWHRAIDRMDAGLAPLPSEDHRGWAEGQ